MERLFVAIDISDSQVADALKRIACGAPNVDWTAPENLHLTLAFIGDPPQPVRQTARLFEAIAVEPFTASLLGVETYDLGNGYSALCARVEKTAELMLPGAYEQERLLGIELVPGALDGAWGMITATGKPVAKPRAVRGRKALLPLPHAA